MRFLLWIALAAQLLLFASLKLFDNWTLEGMPEKFVAGAILCGLAYLIAATEFSAGRASIWLFWSITLALRLLALPLTPAAEVWRYQADGVIQRAHINPYEAAPAEARVREKIPNVAAVPRPNEPTRFSPGAELLFRVLPATSHALLLKIFFGIAELLAIALLLQILDPGRAAWFAWNPLLAYSFFGAGHFDSIVLLAIVALIYFLTQFEKGSAAKHALGAAVALGLAIAFRPICLVLLLPTFFALRRVGFLALLSLLLPAASAAIYGFPRAVSTNLFGDFDYVTRLNDLFWWLIEDTVWSNWHQQYFRYDVVILIVAAIIGIIFARNWRRGMLWSMGSAIILAPILHAWYVTWILPIATLRRVYVWHVLSITIFAYYLFFDFDERVFALPWHAAWWQRGIILAPVIFTALTGAWRHRPQHD